MNMMYRGFSDAAAQPIRHFGSEFHQLSQDLRTPLNAINGFAELLLMDGQLSAAQAEYVRAILTGSETLTAAVVSHLDHVETAPPVSPEARPAPRRSLFKQARRTQAPCRFVGARRLGAR